MSPHALLALAVAALAATAFAGPLSAAPPTSDECLTCHGNRGLTRADGKGSVFVDGAGLHGSVHAGLACVSCHGAATSIPHPDRLPPVRCSGCHAGVDSTVARSAHARVGGANACVTCHGSHEIRRPAAAGQGTCRTCHGAIVAEYQASVHGVALAHGDNEASRCRDCHGPAHSLLSHRDAQSPVSRARLATTCARCHADRELMTRRKITIPEAYALYRRSVHGRSANPAAATCNDCHESHHLRRASDPQSSIYRGNIPGTCGHCHAREGKEYAAGVHGTALARGVTASPVCTDCHGEHLIRGPRDPGSPVGAGGVTRTCSQCHEATGIRETYGLPTGRLSTYEDSYHGLAARGGSPVVANCASCHGYHEILPSSDPRSPIAAANLPRTCGRCHPGAGAKFATSPVHVALATRDQPILFYVRWIYLLLILVTISGMALHNGLDYARKLRASLSRHLGAANGAALHAAAVTGRWFERMSRAERLQHGLLAASFFTLVYTGFALKFPESWLFSWLAHLEHGYSLRSLIHRVAAAVMVGTSLAHLYYLTTRRGRGLLTDMLPRLEDVGEFAGNALYLLGRRPAPPAFGRFGYVEKAEYWALVWGTVVMSATGFALWFENLALRWFGKWALDLATVIHYYEAWLAFLAILVWHIYYVIVNPDVYPMNWTWLTGRISEEQLRHEHPLEWERLTAAERAEESLSQAEQPGESPASARPSGQLAAPGPPAGEEPGPPAGDAGGRAR
jgi:cytochrome b subunit of formate dehydrogenase